MDHGTPWWNMQARAGWTWLTVWMMKQGIQLHFSGYRHPQTQGKMERCNGSLESAMSKRPKPTGQSWQCWLDDYREEHNHIRPHEALHMDVPAQHWQPSPRVFQEQTACEYPDPSNVRKVRENGGVSLRGQSYFVSRAFIGENVTAGIFLEHRVIVCFIALSSASSISRPAPRIPSNTNKCSGLAHKASDVCQTVSGASPLRPLSGKTFLRGQNLCSFRVKDVLRLRVKDVLILDTRVRAPRPDWF